MCSFITIAIGVAVLVLNIVSVAEGLTSLTDEEKDRMAEAACMAEAKGTGAGWVFAIRRPCFGGDIGSFGRTIPSCGEYCSGYVSKVDKQTAGKPYKCIGGYHIYGNEQLIYHNDGDVISRPRIKVLNYDDKACTWGGCGPNYCCCKADV